MQPTEEPGVPPTGPVRASRRRVYLGLLVQASLGIGIAALTGLAWVWCGFFTRAPRFTGEEVALAAVYWPGFSLRSVLLDPRHGCGDPGAQRPWSRDEAEVNWGLAQTIRERLEASGHYEVLLTRDAMDLGCQSVDRRAQQAARHGADVLVSIHAYAGGSERTQARGAMLIWAPSRAGGGRVGPAAQRVAGGVPGRWPGGPAGGACGGRPDLVPGTGRPLHGSSHPRRHPARARWRWPERTLGGTSGG